MPCSCIARKLMETDDGLYCMECGVQVEESTLVNDQFVGEGFGVVTTKTPLTRKREDAAYKIRVLAQNLGFDPDSSITKDTQELYRILVSARSNAKDGNDAGRLLVVNGLDVTAGCCLWIICRKSQQLTKHTDIADALNVNVKVLRKRHSIIQKLMVSEGLAAQYRAAPVPAAGHVDLVVSKLVPPKHSEVRQRIAVLTKKCVTLAEQSSVDTGRHREPLVVAAAMLALKGYLHSELNDSVTATMYDIVAEDARQKTEANLKDLRAELNPKQDKVAALFDCGKGVLVKRVSELKDLLLEVAREAKIECTGHTTSITPHLVYLIDNAASYQDMMTITPDVDVDPPTLGAGSNSTRAVGGGGGGGGGAGAGAGGTARGNGKRAKVLDPLGVPPSFEASKRRRIADKSHRVKLVDLAIEQHGAAATAAAAAAAVLADAAAAGPIDDGGAGAGAAEEDVCGEEFIDDVTDDGEQVKLLVKFLAHGYQREQLLTADLDELHAIVSPIIVQEGEELTDADLPASDMGNYIKTDQEVVKLAEQKKMYEERRTAVQGSE